MTDVLSIVVLISLIFLISYCSILLDCGPLIKAPSLRPKIFKYPWNKTNKRYYKNIQFALDKWNSKGTIAEEQEDEWNWFHLCNVPVIRSYLYDL